MLSVPYNNRQLSVEDISKLVEKLPAIPQVAIKVSKMLGDFNVSVDQLADTIMLDQSLTTQLLKLCNSAHYGFSRNIVSLKDAVTKLGLETVKCLVFVAISKAALDKEAKGYSLLKGDLWQNSITCAFYARFLAELFNYKDHDLAFTAGLLRDIGKLIISEYVDINYDKIIMLVDTAEVTFLRAEEMIIGYNHAQIGAEVLKHWQLPSVLEETVRYHHDFSSAYEHYKDTLIDVKLLAILHLADAFTLMLGNSVGSDGLMYSIEDKAIEVLNDKHQNVSIDLIIDQLLELGTEINSIVKVLK
ncbi:MAG: HDOD domain-containing protein [Vampirovibrionia bacterium]